MGRPCCVTLAAVTVIVLIAAAVSAIVVGVVMLSRSEAPEGWDLIEDLEYADEVPVYKMRSRRSGLTVDLFKSRYWRTEVRVCLPTEDNSNDGMPNVVHQFVLKGRSKKYPYFDSLKRLAPVCLADPVTGQTSMDHQCFSVGGPSANGTLRLTNILLDHLFWPDLNEQDFLTLVHHVTRDGKDGGEMYLEMKKQEVDNRMQRSLRHHLYPGMVGGYGGNPFGSTANIRNGSTSLEKARAYHRKFYRPGRVTIVVFGDLKPQQLADALKPLEDELEEDPRLLKDPMPPRPFQEPKYPSLNETETATEYYASDFEQGAYIAVAWKLNFRLTDDIAKYHRAKVLLWYLCYFDPSPLSTALTKGKDSVALYVAHTLFPFSQPALGFSIQQVEQRNMKEALARVDRTLENIKKEGINMTRVREVVRRWQADKRLTPQLDEFKNPADKLRDRFVQDMLFSDSDGDMEAFLDYDEDLYLDWEQEDWNRLYREVFTGPRLEIKFVPSPRRIKNNERYEQVRLKTRKEELGTRGLRERAEKLEAALKNQSQSTVPESFFDNFTVAAPTDFYRPRVKVFNTTSAGGLGAPQPPSDFNLARIPYRFYLSDTDTDYIWATVTFDLSNLTSLEWQYAQLLDKLDLSVTINGGREVIRHADANRAREVASSNMWVEVDPFDQAVFGFTVDPKAAGEDYVEAVKLLKQMVFDYKLESEDLRKLLTNNKFVLRDPFLGTLESYRNAMSTKINYRKGYPGQDVMIVSMKKFEEDTLRRLQRNPNEVVKEAEAAWKKALDPKNGFVHLEANLKKLLVIHGRRASKAWEDFFGKTPPMVGTPLKDVPTRSRREFVDLKKENDVRHAVVVHDGSGGDACELGVSVPLAITSRSDPEYAAYLVALKYVELVLEDRLSSSQSDKSKPIGGDACHRSPEFQRERYWFKLESRKSMNYLDRNTVRTGLTTLNLVGCKDSVGAFQLFYKLMFNLTMPHGESNWEKGTLEVAKSRAILEILTPTLDSMGGYSGQRKGDVLLREGLDPLFDNRLGSAVPSLTLEAVALAARRHLSEFGRPGGATVAGACGRADLARVLRRGLASSEAAGGANFALIEDVERSSLFRS